ncbi:hypothetical protein [Streptomyces sp. RG80]|uniref:hypothetical protein n=1 Tax=Streptomyces sp. RG80 TaxID=3157340 RepID=UPI00338D57DD
MSWKARQLWLNADQVSFFMATFTVLPFGEETRRGEVRSVSLTAASLWGIGLLFLTAWTEEGSAITGVIFLISMAVIALSLILEACVVLFNWPKFVVPPHMRSDLGVIAANRARRRKVRRRSVRD